MTLLSKVATLYFNPNLKFSEICSVKPMANSKPLFSTIPALMTGEPDAGALAPKIPDTGGATNKSSVRLL